MPIESSNIHNETKKLYSYLKWEEEPSRKTIIIGISLTKPVQYYPFISDSKMIFRLVLKGELISAPRGLQSYPESTFSCGNGCPSKQIGL